MATPQTHLLTDEHKAGAKQRGLTKFGQKTMWKSSRGRLQAGYGSCNKCVGRILNTLKRWFLALWVVSKIRELSRKLQRRLTTKWPGWELGVVAAIFLASCALTFNLVFLAAAVSADKWGTNGLGTLMEDECDRIDIGNKVAHIFINVVSTVKLPKTG